MSYGYDNRLLNVPAPIGYGVTTPQDLRSYLALGNRFYTTNFGMETQYNLFDPGYSPIAYHLAQNPQLAFTNPMLFGYNLDGMGAAPSVSMPSLPSNGGSAFSNIVKQRIAQQVPQTLAGLEKNLTEILKNDKLNDEQKSRIQAKLDEIKALKNQIQTALSNESSTAQDLYALEAEVTKLQQEISQLGQTLAQEVQDAQASESSDNDNSERASGADDADKPKIPESELETYCHNVEACIYGAGTDEEGLLAELQKLNKDNIIEVIGHWEATKGKHKDNEGMIARILKDLNDGEQKQMVPFIRDALIKRAEELGIYSEIKNNVSAVNTELLKERKWYHIGWFYGGQDDNVIKNNLMEIYDKIVAKEGKKSSEAKQKAETKKAEAEKNEADKAKEAKDLFLADMREIWKDEKAEISDRVKYENGKFKVRIEGKEYYGSDFNELVKNIRNAGYDPEQYLKKQQLQAAA